MDLLEATLPKEKLPALQELKAFIEKFQSEKFEPIHWKGYRFPGGFNPKNITYAYDEWDIPENSVFLQSYPKTGTNWAIEILRQILYGQDDELVQLSKSIPIMLFGMQMGPVSKFQLMNHLPLPRKFSGSHVSEELFNFEKMKQKKGKMIYVMRNPKDQAVSWFHFINNAPMPDDLKAAVEDGWNTFIDNYIHGKMPVFSKPGEWYPEHIRGWLKHEKDKDFLLLVFEEMKRDLPKQVRRIAEFVDVDLTDDDVNKIADKCSFSSMKESLKNDPVELRRNIARKGEVGGWKDYFTVAQSELVDKMVEEKLGDTGLKFIYDL